METYTLTSNGYDYLLKKIGDLNKRANKLNLPYINAVNVRKYTEVKVSTNENTADEVIPMVEFSLEGNKPVVSGYKVVAVLENVNGENLINYLINETEDEHDLYEFRRRVSCDHCNHNRARKHTYILQDETIGNYIQVGRTCLQDFLEGDITYLINYAKLDIAGIEKEAVAKGFCGEPSYVGIDSFVAMTLEFIRDNGYVSAKSEYIKSTAVSVWDNFYPTTQYDSVYRLSSVLEKNQEEADNVVEWAKGLADSGSDYLYNLSVIAKDGEVTWKRKGYSASMVTAYMKHMEQEVEKAEKVEEPTEPEVVSNYVGTVGDTVEREVTVVKVFEFEGLYGMATMILFKDIEGNVLRWTTGSKHWYEENDKVTVSAQVKNHTEYKGIKQTQVLRVKQVNQIIA